MDPTIIVRDLLREYTLRRAPIDVDLKGPTLKACLRTIDKNRLANLLLLDHRSEAMINSYREGIWSTNSSALLTILHVLPIFETNQIHYCIIKGPPLLKDLYEDYFFRPATDVDILVQPSEFDRAAGHLREAGFALRSACESVYWRFFLGEQHFDPATSELSVIDLHRHVYHPAGLGAKEADAYFLQGARRELNGKWFAVPSRVGQALLSVLYTVKSLIRSEPAGHYLLDFALIIIGMSKDEYRNLVRQADQKNLLRALSLAVSIMQIISTVPDELRPLLTTHSFKTLSPYDIFKQLISPGTRNIKMGIYILRCATETGDFKKGLVWEIGRKLAQTACHAGLF